jgi:hypothetical protein
MIELISDAARRELFKFGWTIKARHVDRDEAKPLLGIRLTNCEALFNKALSIQILDDSTVSLSFGFSNDEHVSLTEDDGRAFLEYLKLIAFAAVDDAGATYSLLTDELLAQIGKPIPREEQIPVFNMEKARLVDYLVQNSPQTFGKYGTARAGGDFYAEVLELIKDPSRDEEIARRMIHALESTAHTFYADANRMLHVAAQSNAPARSPHRMEAFGMIRAAEELRDRANDLRGKITDDPPAETPYPDAIAAGELAESLAPAGPWDAPIDAATTDLAAAQLLARQDVIDERAFNAIILKPGDMVTVSDSAHPLYRRMGEVVAASGAARVTVHLAGDAPNINHELNRSLLAFLSSPK